MRQIRFFSPKNQVGFYYHIMVTVEIQTSSRTSTLLEPAHARAKCVFMVKITMSTRFLQSHFWINLKQFLILKNYSSPKIMFKH